jgi:hypothetical protein
VEGHYAMLRCDEVCGPMYRDVTMLNDGDREYNGFMSDLADMRWDDDGKANDSDRYDIIATIRPEAMQSAASGAKTPDRNTMSIAYRTTFVDGIEALGYDVSMFDTSEVAACFYTAVEECFGHAMKGQNDD